MFLDLDIDIHHGASIASIVPGNSNHFHDIFPLCRERKNDETTRTSSDKNIISIVGQVINIPIPI